MGKLRELGVKAAHGVAPWILSGMVLVLVSCASRNQGAESTLDGDKRLDAARNNEQNLVGGVIDESEAREIEELLKVSDGIAAARITSWEGELGECRAILMEAGVPDDHIPKLIGQIEYHNRKIESFAADQYVANEQADFNQSLIDSLKHSRLLEFVTLGQSVPELISKRKDFRCEIETLKKEKMDNVCRANLAQAKVQTHLIYRYRALANVLSAERVYIPDFEELRVRRAVSKVKAKILAGMLSVHARNLLLKNYEVKFKKIDDEVVFGMLDEKIKHIDDMAQGMGVIFLNSDVIAAVKNASQTHERLWVADSASRAASFPELKEHANAIQNLQKTLRKAARETFKKGATKEALKDNLIDLENLVGLCSNVHEYNDLVASH